MHCLAKFIKFIKFLNQHFSIRHPNNLWTLIGINFPHPVFKFHIISLLFYQQVYCSLLNNCFRFLQILLVFSTIFFKYLRQPFLIDHWRFAILCIFLSHPLLLLKKCLNLQLSFLFFILVQLFIIFIALLHLIIVFRSVKAIKVHFNLKQVRMIKIFRYSIIIILFPHPFRSL